MLLQCDRGHPKVRLNLFIVWCVCTGRVYWKALKTCSLTIITWFAINNCKSGTPVLPFLDYHRSKFSPHIFAFHFAVPTPSKTYAKYLLCHVAPTKQVSPTAAKSFPGRNYCKFSLVKFIIAINGCKLWAVSMLSLITSPCVLWVT